MIKCVLVRHHKSQTAPEDYLIEGNFQSSAPQNLLIQLYTLVGSSQQTWWERRMVVPCSQKLIPCCYCMKWRKMSGRQTLLSRSLCKSTRGMNRFLGSSVRSSSFFGLGVPRQLRSLYSLFTTHLELIFSYSFNWLHHPFQVHVDNFCAPHYLINHKWREVSQQRWHRKAYS